MKKVIMIIGAIVFSTTLFAQDSEGSDNPWTLEGAINYNSTDGLTFSSPSVRARYFVKDNIAVRADLSFGFNSGSEFFYENADGTGGMGSIYQESSNWSMMLGGEYHLGGTEKLSPYFSAGVMFGGSSAGLSSTDVDDVDPTLASYMAGMTTAGDQSNNMIGFGIGAGMDYYVWNNVYVGLEIGLNWTRWTYGDLTGSATIDMGGVSTTSDYVVGGSEETGISTAAGAIRLGWRF